MDRDREFPFRAVIFDLDGTLADSLADVAASVNAVLAQAGVAAVPREAWRSLLGEGSRIRMKTAFAINGITLADEELDGHVNAFRAVYSSRMLDQTRPFDGAVEAVRQLAGLGVKIGVCTNKDEAAARRLLTAFGLSADVAAVAGPDTYGVQKPHRDHVLKLLDTMGVEPRDAVLVGDSVHDVEAARNAGIPVAFVSWGYGEIAPGGHGPDYVVADFPALIPALSAARH